MRRIAALCAAAAAFTTSSATGSNSAHEPDTAEPESAPGQNEDQTLVVSGGMKGEGELEGHPAILDVPVGRGRIVTFGFDPIHRTLARSDFRLVWNALLNWNDLPGPVANPPAVSTTSAPTAAAGD